MTIFKSTADPKELVLVEAVARLVDPLSFHDFQIVGTEAEQGIFRSIQDKNRIRALELALEVIELVRFHDRGSP